MQTLAEIDEKLKKTRKALNSIRYAMGNISAKEFHDYMTGEIFSEDTTTLRSS